MVIVTHRQFEVVTQKVIYQNNHIMQTVTQAAENTHFLTQDRLGPSGTKDLVPFF